MAAPVGNLGLETRDPRPVVFTHGLSVPLGGPRPPGKLPLDSLPLASEFVTKAGSFGPRPRPEVELIFTIRRDFAVIKEPFPADMLILAASKSYRRGADR